MLFNMNIKTIEQSIGNTPLIRAAKIDTGSSQLLFKLEGNNPGGSVKDRPALWMIKEAEKRGRIKPGDTLIEATSGNTGIGLAMCAAVMGYKMILVMPETASRERRDIMGAYNAELVLTGADGGMEETIDTAKVLAEKRNAFILDQFNNPDNPLAHYSTTGPELWDQTEGKITHFVSSMGTTGTIMGCSRFLKEKNPDIKIIGVQPVEGSKIPGIRKWPEEYLPGFYESGRTDDIVFVSRDTAEESARMLAAKEGIFCGISGGGAAAAAMDVCRGAEEAVVTVILPDRGDRYLSTGVFSGDTEITEGD